MGCAGESKAVLAIPERSTAAFDVESGFVTLRSVLKALPNGDLTCDSVLVVRRPPTLEVEYHYKFALARDSRESLNLWNGTRHLYSLDLKAGLTWHDLLAPGRPLAGDVTLFRVQGATEEP
jgi:hypothetical protein